MNGRWILWSDPRKYKRKSAVDIVRSNLSESVYSARECLTGLCTIRSGGNMCAEYVVSIRKVRHGHGHAELHAGHAELHAADDDGPDVLRAADADDLRGGPD